MIIDGSVVNYMDELDGDILDLFDCNTIYPSIFDDIVKLRYCSMNDPSYRS